VSKIPLRPKDKVANLIIHTTLFADFLHKRELRLESERSSAAIPVEELEYRKKDEE
jgi:hypothetical protein